MMTYLQNNSQRPGNEQMDSIIATCMIPSHVMFDHREIKEFLVGHFAHFGTIVRVSCTTKANKARVAHIQYSSAAEASNAKKNANSLQGITFSITLTGKHPSTQPLAIPPTPLESKLFPSTLNTTILSSSPTSVAQSRPTTNPNLGQPIHPFFKTSDPAQRNADIGYQNHVSAHVQPRASNSGSIESSQPQPVQEEKPNVCVIEEIEETKPNTCVKIEIYSPGEKSDSQANVQQQRNSPKPASSTLCTAPSLHVDVPRPTRTLSQILNVDISGMKVVPTIHTSDALACRAFYGRNHPFPIAQMFGRPLGQVILPVKDVIQSIKPGMEISKSTLEMIWNTIEDSVVKHLVKQYAKKALLVDQILSEMMSECFDLVGDSVINDEITNAAKQELEHEENCLADAELVFNDVCKTVIESSAQSQLQMMSLISEVAEAFYDANEKQVVEKKVQSVVFDEFINYLCDEVIEDLIDCPYLNGYVRIIGAKVLRECQLEEQRIQSVGRLRGLPSPSRALMVKRWVNDIPAESKTMPSQRDARYNPFMDNQVTMRHSSFYDDQVGLSTQLAESETKSEAENSNASAGVIGRLKRKATTLLQIFGFKRSRQDI